MNNQDSRMIFRSDRLTLLALSLRKKRISHRITLLEDFDLLFEESEISVFPVFEDVLNSIPELFSKSWKKNKGRELIWLEKPNQCTLTSIMEFFGLEQPLFIHIYVPYGQLPENFGGEIILKKTNGKQLSQNILEVVYNRNNMMIYQPSTNLFISKN